MPAPAFLDRLACGTLDQQQGAIAAISRDYHPNMRPALMAALASPVPALRVQAAAVFARLRGTYGERAKALLACEDASAQDLQEVAASGFVDAGDVEITVGAGIVSACLAYLLSEPHYLCTLLCDSHIILCHIS